MHKFSFKWAQLTFSCLLFVLFLYFFYIIFYIYIYTYTCDAYGNFTAWGRRHKAKARYKIDRTQWAKDGIYTSLHVISLSLGYSSVAADRIRYIYYIYMQMGYKNRWKSLVASAL